MKGLLIMVGFVVFLGLTSQIIALGSEYVFTTNLLEALDVRR